MNNGKNSQMYSSVLLLDRLSFKVKIPFDQHRPTLIAFIPIITPTPKFLNQPPIKIEALITTTFRLSQDQKPHSPNKKKQDPKSVLIMRE